MEKGKTYEVICATGRNRDICELVLNKGWHCTECSHARYKLREHVVYPEEPPLEEEKQEETQENGK